MELLLERALPRKPEILPVARQVVSVAEKRCSPEQWAALRLLVTELVANEIEHGEGHDPFILRIKSHPLFIRVEVIDEGSVFSPNKELPSSLSEGGRGYFLIESLSIRSGIEKVDDGHICIWFDLACGVEHGSLRRAFDRLGGHS